MKQTTFYSVVTFLIAAFLYAQYAVAMPNTMQSATFQMSPLASLQIADEDLEEPEEHDQCRLLFPFCEAN